MAPTTLVRKLAAVMAAVHHVPKRGRNAFHGYDYATEADIVAVIRQELATRHVMLIPSVESIDRQPVGEKGSVLTTLSMRFTFLDGESGESLERPWCGAGTDKEDKGLYKAMTGGEKYFLLKTFLIPTGDDPERDTDKPPRGSYTVDAPARPPARPPEEETRETRAAATGGDTAALSDPPAGAVFITKVEAGWPNGKAKGFLYHSGQAAGGDGVPLYQEKLVDLASAVCQAREPVRLEIKTSASGKPYVKAIYRLATDVEPAPIAAEDIPF